MERENIQTEAKSGYGTPEYLANLEKLTAIIYFHVLVVFYQKKMKPICQNLKYK